MVKPEGVVAAQLPLEYLEIQVMDTMAEPAVLVQHSILALVQLRVVVGEAGLVTKSRGGGGARGGGGGSGVPLQLLE